MPVANPTYIFDAQFTYDIHPLLFEPITSGSGASVAHDSTNRCALLTFSSTPTGGKAQVQTFEYFRYQPGRAHHTVMTFNFRGGVANCVKFARYGDGTDGVGLRLNGTTAEVFIDTSSTAGAQIATQANWDDPLDGTGESGIRVDWENEQILDIDLQALYVGEVRYRLNIGGQLIQFHAFKNANNLAYPYLATANLPISAGMTCTGTVSTTMLFNCCSLISEGGTFEQQGFEHSIEVAGTAGNEVRAHILSIRPKTTFNSITNRSKIVLESIEAVIASGANPVTLELALGQAISGTTTFNNVNATYSGVEYNSAGAISGSPAIVTQTLELSATSSGRNPSQKNLGTRYPLTLDAAGAVRALGTLSVLGTGHTGTSPVRVALNCREIR